MFPELRIAFREGNARSSNEAEFELLDREKRPIQRASKRLLIPQSYRSTAAGRSRRRVATGGGKGGEACPLDSALESKNNLERAGYWLADQLPRTIADGLIDLERRRRRFEEEIGGTPRLLIRTDDLAIPWDICRLAFEGGEDFLNARFDVGFVTWSESACYGLSPLNGICITHPCHYLDEAVHVAKGRDGEQDPVYAAALHAAQKHRDGIAKMMKERSDVLSGIVCLNVQSYQNKDSYDDWRSLFHRERLQEGEGINLLFFLGHWSNSPDGDSGFHVSYNDPSKKGEPYSNATIPLTALNVKDFASPVLFLDCCGTNGPPQGDALFRSWQTANVQEIHDSFVKKPDGARAYIGARGPIENEVASVFAKNFFKHLLEGNCTLGYACARARRDAQKYFEELAREGSTTAREFREEQILQTHLFFVSCSDSSIWGSRVTVPTIECRVIYPRINATYYRFFDMAVDFKMPATIVTHGPAADFGEASEQVEEFLAKDATRTDRLLLADLTVLAFCMLKARGASDLVIIGSTFRMGGPRSCGRAELFVPLANDFQQRLDDAGSESRDEILRHNLEQVLAVEGTRLLHMDELASIYPMLLSYVQGMGRNLGKPYNELRSVIFPQSARNIREEMERYASDGNFSDLRPFLLFSAQDRDAFFDQIKKRGYDYQQCFHRIDVYDEYVRSCGTGQLQHEFTDLPVQFLVTTKSSLARYREAYREILTAWRQWMTRRAKNNPFPDDVSVYPPTEIIKLSKMFVDYVRDNFGDCFALGCPAALTDSDFDMIATDGGDASPVDLTADAIRRRARETAAHFREALGKLAWLKHVRQDIDALKEECSYRRRGISSAVLNTLRDLIEAIDLSFLSAEVFRRSAGYALTMLENPDEPITAIQTLQSSVDEILRLSSEFQRWKHFGAYENAEALKQELTMVGQLISVLKALDKLPSGKKD